MKHLLIVLLLLVGVVGVAHAQSGSGYDLEWNTIDNGGAAFATGGGYALRGSIGQPDAGALAGSHGYTLSGGFWLGGGRIPTPPEYHLFLPIVVRSLS